MINNYGHLQIMRVPFNFIGKFLEDAIGFFSSIFRGRDAPVSPTTKKIYHNFTENMTDLHKLWYTIFIVGFYTIKLFSVIFCIKTDIHSKRRLQKEGMD